MRLVSFALLAILLPSIAAAQNGGIFFQAAPLVDARFMSNYDSPGFVSARFVSGLPLDEGIPSDEQTKSTQSRFAPGGSVAVGVFVSPTVSLRVEASLDGKYVDTTEVTSVRASTRFASRQTQSSHDIYVVAGWHPKSARRAQVSYLAGVAFRRESIENTSSFTYPAASLQQVRGRLVQTVTPRTEEDESNFTLYGAGVIVGVDVAFDLAEHIALVPQIRMVSASNQWNIRPALAIRWRP